MKIFPQKLAIKYNPPRICLIYLCNNESLFHDFPVNSEDIKLSSAKLYTKLNLTNPGYLDQIDREQVCEMIDLIKKNCQKSSKAQRLRGIVTGYRQTDESDSDNAEEGTFDFNKVEKQFEMSDEDDLDLKL